MRRHLPLIAICLGYFMVILDATIVNVALPSIGRELGGGVSALQWVVDAYTVVFAGLLLSAGALGDRIGAKPAFDAGLSLFTVASAACALAPGIELLIAARAVQGLGAALLVPNSLSLLRAAYADPSSRARAVGAWGAIAGVGAASGPILGGLLVGLLGWRAVFVVNVPIGALTMWLGARHLRRITGAGTDGGLDPLGQACGIILLTLVTVGLIEGGAAGFSSPAALAPLLVSLPVLALFVAVERRVREPMVPTGLFRDRTFAAASFVGLAINLGFYGQLFALSIYFQRDRGFSALQTGLALLPEGIFVALSSALSGRLTGRIGPRTPMLTGLLCGAAGFGGLMAAGNDTGYAVLVGPLVVAGFGMAFTMPAATAAIIEAAPPGRAGIASGILNAARQTGGAIGIALIGSMSAIGTAMALSATSFLLAAAVVLIAVRPQAHRPAIGDASS